MSGLSDDQLNSALKDHAKSLHGLNVDILQAAGIDPATATKIAGALSSAGVTAQHVWQLFLQIAITVADKALAFYLRRITEFRAETNDSLNEATAEILNEFLGTQFTAGQVTGRGGGDATLAKASAIGTAILNRLEQEFTKNGTVTPESGAAGARTFAGYAVNFGIQNGMLTLLGGAIPGLHLDDIREIGEEVAQNLGLGRLVRQAVMPLVRNTIQQPYDRALRQKYRQDLMGDTELAKAYATGKKAPAAARAELQQKGYTDEDIELLLDLLVPGLAAAALATLERNGLWTHDAALAELARRGTPNTIAEAQLQAERLNRTDSIVQGIITEQRAKVLDGYLSPQDFDTIIGALPLPQEERDWLSRDVGLRLATPRATLTWTQLQAAFFDGIIDFDRVDQWMSDRGYSPDDSLTLELLMLKKLDDKITAAQVKAAKAAPKGTKTATLASTPAAPPATPPTITP